MEFSDLLQVIGQLGGLAALGVFIVLGYRIYQDSVSRSRDIDAATIESVREQLRSSDSRVNDQQQEINELRSKFESISIEFIACKESLYSVMAKMRDLGFEPDHPFPPLGNA